MHAFATALFPFCRSITGDGVRETLRQISQRIPLAQHEVPSGTPVFDWTVPDEWNIRDAYVADDEGTRVIDFQQSNLHVVGYSEPVRATLNLADLREHLHTHPDAPRLDPVAHIALQARLGFLPLATKARRVAGRRVRSRHRQHPEPGSLTYGECYIPGDSEAEVLLSTHICHPSLANDNLSGIALLTELAGALAAAPRRLSYRLIFIPSTIGSLAWLTRNAGRLGQIKAGLVIACVGDGGPLAYKRSRSGDAAIDTAAAHVVGDEFGGRILDFIPWGWDERQFNSPGFKLPVGCLSRSREGEYPEYHSSADDLDLIKPQFLEESLAATLGIVDVLEGNRVYTNLEPHGEPNLGSRGLYRSVGGGAAASEQLAILWVLNQSDGTQSLLDIAERSGLTFRQIRAAADDLLRAGLLAETFETDDRE